MSSSTRAKKHSQYEPSISLPPISEFSSRFRLPASPPMSIPNKRIKRTIDNNTANHLTDSSTPFSLPILGEPSVWDMQRSMPKVMPPDDKTPQPQIPYNQLQQHATTSQHDQRHGTLSPSPPPTPPLPLPTSFGYYNKAGMDANHESGSNATSTYQTTPVTKEGMSSAQVLAEKRKRNAGASARFRERRKLRERDLQETCKLLDRRVFALESALKQLDPNHSLLVPSSSTAPTISNTNNTRTNQVSSLSPEPSTAIHHSQYHQDYHNHHIHHHHSQNYSATHAPTTSSSPPPPLSSSSSSSSPPTASSTLDQTLNDRVGQLEYMMTLLHQEKVTDTKKLASLEKENRHLRTKMMVNGTKQQYDLDDDDAGGDGHSIVSTSSSLSAGSRKKSLTPTYSDTSTNLGNNDEPSAPSQ